MEHVHKAVETISRSNLQYWINGGGSWSDRITYTSSDMLLMFCSTSICLIMLCMYVFYSFQVYTFSKIVKEKHYIKHHKYLCAAFLICGFIHFLNTVVAWFVPLYWFSISLMLINSIVMYKLILSKSHLLSMQNYINGEIAVEKINHTLDLIRSKDSENINDILTRIEGIIKR